MRDAVKEDLEGREKQAAASKHLDEVLSTVSDQATLEIPPQMVDERADEMFHELERSLGAQGIGIDKYLEVMNAVRRYVQGKLQGARGTVGTTRVSGPRSGQS